MALCIHGFKQLRVKNIQKEISRNLQRIKLEFATWQQIFTLYLQQSIYIVLGITSNPENLIYKGEHARVTGKCYIIYTRTLSAHSFRYLQGVGAWNQFPMDTIMKNESHCVC